MRFASVIALTTSVVLLAACGGGEDSGLSYNGLVNRGVALGDRINSADPTPTSAMPTSGTASYAGVAGFSTSLDAEDPEVIAEALLTAEFSSSTISGQLTNFRNEDNTAIAGTVTIEPGLITGSEFSNTLSGALTAEGETVAVTGTMESGFLGEDAGLVLGVIDGTVGGESVAGVLIGERQ